MSMFSLFAAAAKLPLTNTVAETAENAADTFLNINVYMFFGAVILLLVCTLVYLIFKFSKRKQ